MGLVDGELARLKGIAGFLDRQSRGTLIRGGLVMVLLIGVANYLAGEELSLFIFYLVPITIITSYAGVTAGLIIALAGAVMWQMVELLEGRQYSHPVIAYWNAVVRLGFLSIVVMLQNALARAKHVARTDYLTGLANRLCFVEIAESELHRSRRYGLPFSVAYIDIDNFKGVNDQFGHAVGDKLLRTVGNIVGRNVRSEDTAARLGGDEYALLLPQADAESAKAVLSKMQVLLQNAVNARKWPVTFSFGVVTFLEPPETVDEVIKQADDLMYAAKEEGKNTMRFAVVGNKDAESRNAQLP